MPEPQTLMTGIVFGESPRWRDGRLWYSDWGSREIVAVDPEGRSEVIVRLPSSPFSIDWLPDGRLLVVSASDGLLLRREPDGSLVTHSDLSSLSNHPWNDIVVDGRGNAYVGNIGFDFPDGEFVPGTLALVTPEGSVRRVADGLAFPNGVVVTPDNSTLICAESYGSRLTAFDIAADGSLSNRRVWADLGDGVPDGICLDAEGAVWYGDVPNRRCVHVREGGEVLQRIELNRGCFACMLGGIDGRTLFMVAQEWRDTESTTDGEPSGRILTVPAPAAGAGWPQQMGYWWMPRKEWETALDSIQWLRERLDEAGRVSQRLLVLGDAGFCVAEFFHQLPWEVDLMARCTRNRALYALPENGEEKPGRNRKYGDTARKPHEWLTEESGWRRTDFQNGTSATVITRLPSEKLLTG